MTVHMVRVVTAPQSLALSDVNSRLDTWVSNHTEWTADAVPHQARSMGDDPDYSGDVFYIGDYRFESSDSKSTLLQDCEDQLQNHVEWYRLGFHACDHDETDRTGCDWDDEREWTSSGSTIPDDAPNFL